MAGRRARPARFIGALGAVAVTMASSSKKPFRIPKRKTEPNDEDDAAKQPRLDSNTIDLIEAAPPAAGFSLKLEAPAPPPAKPPPPPAPSFIRRHVQQQKSEPVGPPAASKQQLGTVVPDGWLDCAKGSLATALHGICAIKSPMTASLTQYLPSEARWTPMDAVMACGARRVRLIVDLTSTVRYYQPEELPTGIRHLKLPVSGHSVPSEDALAHAIKLIREIRAYHGENSIVLVHCTHGLNRTGQQRKHSEHCSSTAALPYPPALIPSLLLYTTHTGYFVVHALVALEQMAFQEALAKFNQIRPPGKQKQPHSSSSSPSARH